MRQVHIQSRNKKQVALSLLSFLYPLLVRRKPALNLNAYAFSFNVVNHSKPCVYKVYGISSSAIWVDRFTDMFVQKINETAAKFLIIKPKTRGISRCAMLDYEKTAMVINRRRARVCQSTEFT